MIVIMQCHTIVHGSACMTAMLRLEKASYFDQEHTLLRVVSVAKGTNDVVKGLAEPVYKSETLQSGRSSKLGSESVISAISYTLCSVICLTTEQSIVRNSVL